MIGAFDRLHSAYIERPLIPWAPRARQAARNRSTGSVDVAKACFALISNSFWSRAVAAIRMSVH